MRCSLQPAHQTMREQIPPLVGPFKGIDRDSKFKAHIQIIGFCKTGFGLFPKVLEDFGSSVRLVGTISAYPGTCPTPW